jgi:peptidyl-prolyl cis-trans isomerase SurA
MVERKGEDAIVRLILRVPPVTDEEINQAKAKLDSVRAKIIAGTIGFNAAALRYSDDETQKFTGPFLLSNDGSTFVTIDQMDKDMVGMIGTMKVGDISQPTAFKNEQEKKGVRLVYLKSRSNPHRMNLEDDYSRISQMALDEKKAMAVDKWIKTRMPTYYIMVDKDVLAACNRLEKFVTNDKSF